MAYKYAPITVDLSAFGEGLFATFLHPKLQPQAVYQEQKRIAAKAAASLPPGVVAKLQESGGNLQALSVDMLKDLEPFLGEQMAAQTELAAILILDWNLTDPFDPDGKVLPVPRSAPDGKVILDKVPGAALDAITAAIQEAMNEGPDPTSASPSAS